MAISAYSALFQSRFHGAASLNGFYYQILVSVSKALELSLVSDFDMILEGIEDIDINGNFEIDKAVTESQYIQIKFRETELKYSEFQKIVFSFAKTYKVDQSRTFLIVTNNSVAALVKDFFRLGQCRSKHKIKKKIMASGVNQGITSNDCDRLLNAITLEILTPEQLERNCLRMITERHVGSDIASETILKRLIVDFINKAITRQSFKRVFVDNACMQVLETISSQEYNAYGSGLIERINWSNCGDAHLFYQGKNPLPGDISRNLDYKRSSWLDAIKRGFERSKTVVIKAVSGQGKTSLIYRYAKEYGLDEATHIINHVNSEPEVVAIAQYLDVRGRLGVPLLVLIDDIKYNKMMWSKLIAHCLHLDIKFLITIREENWLRYSSASDVEVEIVSPFLNENEAQEIYTILLKRGYVNDDRVSAKEFYEKLGSKKLLLEFIYLITQGIMLKDRLTDQIREIDNTENAQLIRNILRYVCLSDLAGVELSIHQIRTITGCDIEKAVSYVINEHITVEFGMLKGLHEIRSEHMVEILHSEYVTYSDTARAIIPMLSSNQLTPFIYMLITKKFTTFDYLLNGYNDLYERFTVEKVNCIIEAVYHAGIDNYVQSNLPMINEAYSLQGYNAINIMCYELLLKNNGNKTESILSSLGDIGTLPFLKKIMEKEVRCDSGIEYVRRFISRIEVKKSINDLYNLGVFLEWGGFSSSSCENWSEVKNDFVFEFNFDTIDFDALCSFTYGLYMFDVDIYNRLISLNMTNLLDYLKFQLDCTEIELTSNEITLHFIPMLSDFEGYAQTNQAVPRIERIHKIFPYLDSYNSVPDEEILPGINPSHTNNRKTMLSKYINQDMRSHRNRLFTITLLKAVVPESSNEVERYWIELRDLSVKFISSLNHMLNPRSNSMNRIATSVHIQKLDILLQEIHSLLNHVPHIAIMTDNTQCFGHRMNSLLFNDVLHNWSTFLFNFYNQIGDALSTPNQNVRLCLSSLDQSIKLLPAIQSFFWKLYCDTPRRAEEGSLSESETREYQLLSSLMDLRFIRKIDKVGDDPLKHALELKEVDSAKIIDHVRSELDGCNVTIVEYLHNEQELSYIVILYECSDPLVYYTEMLDVVQILSAYQNEKPEGFWLIPTFQRKRFINKGYLFYLHTVRSLVSGDQINWELLVPRDIPDELLPCIEEYGCVIEIPEFNVATELAGRRFSQQFIDNLSDKVEILPESSVYERMLKEKYQKKISEMRAELNEERESDN